MTDRAVLSVDFELFTQTPAYRRAAGATDEEAVGLAAADYLLDVLAEHDATATFFVVSSVAERHPDVVRRIAEAGHEVASHTHTHRLLSTLDGDERTAEIERSRAVLERVAGEPVSGFRAPAFDLPPGIFDDLEAAGYGYDSSVIPARAVPGWYGGEHDLHRPAPARRVRPGAPGGLAELPVSVMPGLRLPLSGAWLRFFGPRYTATGMRLLARRGVAPVLYLHPWELVDLPAVDGVPRRVYWRTGAWARRAVERLLAGPFEFVPARTVVVESLESAGAASTAVADEGRGATAGEPRGSAARATPGGRDPADRNVHGASGGDG